MIGRFATSLAVALLAFVWLGVVVIPTLFPGIGPVPLFISAFVALLLGVLSLRFIRPASEERRLGLKAIWPALVMPAIGSALLLTDWVRGGVAPRWALIGDMAWNTAQSLFIHADGGVQPAVHSNPAPLTNLLFAVGYGPAGEPSLGYVLGVHAFLIILLAAASSVLSGLYIARRCERLHPFVRVCFVLALGWLPYSGALLGNVIWYGHANVLTSYLLLWVAWIIFSEPARGYVQKTALLLATATVVAASWAPLVVMPVALALLTTIFAVKTRRSGVRHSRWGVGLACLAFAQLGAYALLVTLPDLRRDGGGLSADGAALPVGTTLALVFLSLLLLAAACTGYLAKSRGGANETYEISLGVGVVCVFAIPVLGYMLQQRMGLEDLWGYYPMKFVALLVTVLAGVLIASVASVISSTLSAGRQTIVAVAAVPLLAMLLVPPYLALGPFLAIAPSVAQTRMSNAPEDAHATKALIGVFEDAPFAAQIAVDVESDPDSARLINNYLIQLSVHNSAEPVRAYAYALDTENTQQVCDLIVVWDRTVTVRTPADKIDEVQQRIGQCAAPASFTVEAVSAG